MITNEERAELDRLNNMLTWVKETHPNKLKASPFFLVKSEAIERMETRIAEIVEGAWGSR